jgi:hypothetical protein
VDVYAFGIVMWEVLTGSKPFEAGSEVLAVANKVRCVAAACATVVPSPAVCACVCLSVHVTRARHLAVVLSLRISCPHCLCRSVTLSHSVPPSLHHVVYISLSVLVRRRSPQVLAGYRPPIPETMPAKLAFLLQQCWAASPLQRPSMDEVCSRLEAIVHSMQEGSSQRPRHHPAVQSLMSPSSHPPSPFSFVAADDYSPSHSVVSVASACSRCARCRVVVVAVLLRDTPTRRHTLCIHLAAHHSSRAPC